MKIKPGMVSVITGAAGGIGLAVAEALAQRQSELALIDIDEAALQKAKKTLERYNRPVSVHCLDVSDTAQMEHLPERILEHHHRIDLLINSAGVSLAGPFETYTIEDLDWIFRINFMGLIYTCCYFLPALKMANEAHIVNISSDFGLFGFPTKAAYCATKFAVRGFTEALRAELSDSQVGVSCVYPGAVDTGFVQKGRAWNLEKQALEARFVQQRGIPVTYVAKRIMDGIEQNAPRVLIGKETYLIDLFTRLFPSIYQRLIPKTTRFTPFI
jgi:short-subunit dehydrogenase